MRNRRKKSLSDYLPKGLTNDIFFKSLFLTVILFNKFNSVPESVSLSPLNPCLQGLSPRSRSLSPRPLSLTPGRPTIPASLLSSQGPELHCLLPPGVSGHGAASDELGARGEEYTCTHYYCTHNRLLQGPASLSVESPSPSDNELTEVPFSPVTNDGKSKNGKGWSLNK